MKKLIFGLLLLSSCSYNSNTPQVGSVYKCKKGVFDKLEFKGEKTVLVSMFSIESITYPYTIDDDNVVIGGFNNNGNYGGSISFKIVNQDTLLLQNNIGMGIIRQDSIFVKVQ